MTRAERRIADAAAWRAKMARRRRRRIRVAKARARFRGWPVGVLDYGDRIRATPAWDTTTSPARPRYSSAVVGQLSKLSRVARRIRAPLAFP